ncbi:hypothetical protein B5807_08407 [Epicoccum nigrum]|uniref:non-specific serine/threonine protein kinase n=1 Tax=Epicoccum nigrum TaxID=105696 RepID=A0A1Y2LRP8_EPING|nr:hypothetical protein B5807_08407 [Epicoccum nigrum]
MASPPATPPRGLHPLNLGDIIDNGRYLLTRKLASGPSSTVWLATREWSSSFKMTQRYATNKLSIAPEYVTVKIMDADVSKTSTELAMLKHLSSVAGREPVFLHIPRLLEHFELESPNSTHQCLVFGVMSTTAASLVKDLLVEKLTVIPVDLRPGEELPVEELPKNQPKITFPAAAPPPDTITPISLRALELLLTLPISTIIDIWSLGCLVYEFLTGEALFTVTVYGDDRKSQDRADNYLLDHIYGISSELPNFIRKAWPRYSKWSYAEPNHLLPKQEGHYRQDDPCMHESLETRFARAKHPGIDDNQAAAICQLIRKMLAYDPAERPTAEELLKCPWFGTAAIDIE